MVLHPYPLRPATDPGLRRSRPGPFARGPLTGRERIAVVFLLAAAGALLTVVVATAVAIALGSALDLRVALELR